MTAGLITGAVGLVAAILTFVVGAWKIRDERKQRIEQFTVQEDQWLAKFEAEREEWAGEKRVALKSELLQERIRRRYESYPEVLSALGAVRDIPDPGREHYRQLEENPTTLSPVADELLRHLYGFAGLVMSMATRNQLLAAWYACKLFEAGEITTDQLVDMFFQARRQLRRDLEIDDSGDVISVASIEKDLGVGAGRSYTATRASRNVDGNSRADRATENRPGRR